VLNHLYEIKGFVLRGSADYSTTCAMNCSVTRTGRSAEYRQYS